MKRIILLFVIINLCLIYNLNAQKPVSETETRTAAVHYAQSFLQYKNNGWN